jgi:hypothetical protein
MNTERAPYLTFRPAQGQQNLCRLFAIYISMVKSARSVFHLVMFLAGHYYQNITRRTTSAYNYSFTQGQGITSLPLEVNQGD